MRIYFSALLLFFLNLGHLYSQKTIWTLQTCVSHALENNLRLKQARLTRSNVQNNLRQSKLQILPTFNVFTGLNYNYGRNIDPFTNQYLVQGIQSNSFQAQTSVTLFNGLQNYHNIKMSKAENESTEFDLEVLRNEISLSVASQYLQVLLSSELVSTASIQYNSSVTLKNRAEVLYTNGKISEADYMQYEAQEASDEFNFVSAKNNLGMAYVNLWLMLDLPADTNRVIETDIAVVPAPRIFTDADAIFRDYGGQRPEVKASEKKVLTSYYALKMSQGARSPRLSFFANLTTLYSSSKKDILGYNLTGLDPSGIVGKTLDTVYTPHYTFNTKTTSYSDQLSDNFGRSAGFSLTLPVLTGGQIESGIRRARINYQVQLLNAAQVKQNLYKNIAQACTDLISAEKKYKSSVRFLEAQRKSFSFARLKLNAGSISYTDYILQQNQLSRAESQWLQSKYEFIFRQKVVEFYMGTPIQL